MTSSDVNAYLAELAGPGVTAKTFRTWGGTTIAAGDPRPRPAAQVASGRPSRRSLAAFDVAAEVLGNTRAVCRSCYVHPVVPESYRDGELEAAWKRSRAGGGLDRAERTVLKLLSG